MFEKMAAGMALAAAVMVGVMVMPVDGHGPVVMAYAADVNNQNSQNISGGGTSTEDKIEEADSEAGGAENSGNNDDRSGIYDFKNSRTTGTVTITKKWDDGLTNAEREIPDMSISTEKPSKSTKGYTVTFHGNGLKFADGTDENMVVYNSSGQIVDGSYKEAVGAGVAWYANKACTQKIEISDAGIPQVELTGDLDLWAKEMTFTLVTGNSFREKTPRNATEVIFTDEVKPKDKEIIDVDADGDGGVVAWLDDDAGTVMKVSTQIPGVKIQAAIDSGRMFSNQSKLQKIDFKMLDMQNATNMCYLFASCSGLTSLDLAPLDTSKVTNMMSMFSNCSGLTSLDLTPLDTQNVTNMSSMFNGCRSLTSLDLSPLDTQKVTSMSSMFSGCSGLTSLDLSPLDTQDVTNMECMFAGCIKLAEIDCSNMNAKKVISAEDMFCYCKNLSELKLPTFSEKLKKINKSGVFVKVESAWAHGMFEKCYKLTDIDLSPLNTSNVTDMSYMFFDCSGLTSLDLSPLDTSKVTNMSWMFDGCSGLTSLDLTPLDTQNVTNMGEMFIKCSGLTSLDLTPLDTQNVTNMSDMFSGCSGLTSLDLSQLNTQKVTNMSYMFSGCSGLTSLDLSPLDTQKVTSMTSMFSGCSGLTSLDLSPLDTQKVTSMTSMFSGCSGLTSLDLSPLDTQNATDMSEMFLGCSGLTSLDLTSMDTQKVTDMRWMFSSCSSLISLTTGTTFKFVGTNYSLLGTWQNTSGETFTSGTFPSNVADTYTKVSS